MGIFIRGGSPGGRPIVSTIQPTWLAIGRLPQPVRRSGQVVLFVKRPVLASLLPLSGQFSGWGGSHDSIVNVGGSDYTVIPIKAGETRARVPGQTPRRN